MTETEGAYFLDTSTQINRSWENDKIVHFLRHELTQRPCYSSVYVKNEYKKNIVKEAVLVYNITVDSSTLDEAKSRLNALLNKIGRRPDELPYRIFNRLFNKFKSIKPYLRRIEKIIEKEWINYFYGDIKRELANLLECNVADDEPVKKGNRYIGVDYKCALNCNLSTFLSQRQDDLRALQRIDIGKLNQINDPKEVFQNTQKASADILNGTLLNKDHCKTISDSIILIEARDSYLGITVYSMDADFDLLGQVLKIPTCVKLKHQI